MKKLKVITVILSVLFFNFIIPASSNAQGLSYGLKGGINYSSLNLKFTGLDKSRIGYHIGGFVNVPLGEKFSVQPELLYSTKGSKADYSFFEFLTGNISLDLKYLDMPVVGVYKLSDNFSLHAGPYASLLLDSKLSNNTILPFLNTSIDIGSGIFSKLDYGFVAGAGVSLGKLGASLRYNYGLGKVEKIKYLGALDYNITNARNTVWQLGVSYSF
jgi:hypothetical protein